MKTKNLLTFTLICLTFFGCKTEPKIVETNQTNVNSANSNKQNSNLEKTETVSSDKVFSSIATPKDTFKSHYAALAANDETLLKKTLSAGMLSLYNSLLKDKKIVEMMRETLKRQGETTDMPTILSEEITGNTAMIKWKANDGVIVDQPLVKEKDGWKMQIHK